MAKAVQAGDLAPTTLDKTLTTLSTCLNTAVKDHLITTNPAWHQPRPTSIATKQRLPSQLQDIDVAN
jgi:hypothetical protein